MLCIQVMCCIFENIFKFILIFVSVCVFAFIYFYMAKDLKALQTDGSARLPGLYYTLWVMHCWCGISLAVLKLKDMCYLHWWIVMTAPLIVGGIFITFLQHETEGFSTGKRASNYFALNYMLVTVLTLAVYSRSLRPQEEE